MTKPKLAYLSHSISFSLPAVSTTPLCLSLHPRLNAVVGINYQAVAVGRSPRSDTILHTLIWLSIYDSYEGEKNAAGSGRWRVSRANVKKESRRENILYNSIPNYALRCSAKWILCHQFHKLFSLMSHYPSLVLAIPASFLYNSH